MSYNRGERDCAWCGGKIVPDDPDEAIVAFECDAHCEDCEAQYLAYIGGETGRDVTDTSFRSTRNDEPGLADFPKFAIRRGIVQRIPWSDAVAVDERYIWHWERFRQMQLSACSVAPNECFGRAESSPWV